MSYRVLGVLEQARSSDDVSSVSSACEVPELAREDIEELVALERSSELVLEHL